MKATFVPAMILAMQGLLLSQFASAQGTLYVSNLGQTPTGSAQIGSDSWIAQGFITGDNGVGYTLNSIQLLMNAGSGNPGGFTVSIYSKTGNPNVAEYPPDHPSSSLATLTGSDPSGGGLFTFTSSSGITLRSDAFYYVVLTSTTPIAQGAYTWSAADSFTTDPTTGWTIDDEYFSSADGSSWAGTLRKDVFQMALSDTPVPEPRSFALAGLALVCFAFRRIWKKRTSSV